MKHHLLLIMILLVAGSLRVQHMTQPYVGPLGWREASTAMMADTLYRGEADLLHPAVRWGGPDNRYQAREFQTVTGITAALYHVFGRADWVGRAVVVSFGLWGIVALYLLVLRLWGKRSAVTCAAMLAVLPGAAYLDRSFLPDPVMTALAVTALWLLVESVRRQRYVLLALAAAVWTLACLTKLQAVILILPAAYILWCIPLRRTDRSDPRPTLGLLAAAGLPTVALAGYYTWVIRLAKSQPEGHIAGQGKFLWDADLAQWLSEFYFLPTVSWVLGTWMWSLPAMILAAIGLLLKPPREGSVAARFTFHWWALAAVLLYLVEAKHMASDPQNLAILNPIAAVFAGLAVAYVVELARPRLGRVVAGSLGLLLILFVAVVGQVVSRPLYQDYHPYWEMYATGVDLAERAEPDELVISMGMEPIAIYYSGLRGWVFPPSASWPDADERLSMDTPERIAMIEALRLRGASWLLIPASNYWGEQLIEHVHENCELVHQSQAGYLFRLARE